jgi:hypothetical protein
MFHPQSCELGWNRQLSMQRDGFALWLLLFPSKGTAAGRIHGRQRDHPSVFVIKVYYFDRKLAWTKSAVRAPILTGDRRFFCQILAQKRKFIPCCFLDAAIA